MTDALTTLSGGCHCGAVRFEVDAPAPLHVLDCNCSMCAMTGFLHLIVPRERFRLLRGEDALAEYRFNTGTARHLFCSRCGIKSFYVHHAVRRRQPRRGDGRARVPGSLNASASARRTRVREVHFRVGTTPPRAGYARRPLRA